MKTFLKFVYTLALISTVQHFANAQTISGPNKPCPGVQVRYKLSIACAGSWSIYGSVGSTIVAQGRDFCDVVFENFYQPVSNVIVSANMNSQYCTGTPPNIDYPVHVQGLPSPPQSDYPIPCNFTGQKTFTIDAYETVTSWAWQTNTGWSVVGGQNNPSVTYNVAGVRTNDYVKVSLSNGCLNLSPTVKTFRIVGTAVTLNQPAFAATNVRPLFICGTSSVNLSIGDVAGATNYVWSTDVSSIRINGLVPPVTLAASNGKNVSVTNTSSTQTDATISVKAVATGCTESATSSVTIPVNKTPEANFIGGFIRDGLDFCPNNVYDFYADNNPALTYTWSIINGTIVYGQGTSMIGVQTNNVSGSGSISFSVRVKYSSACGDGTFFTRTGQISSQGACTFAAANPDFKIGPNPAKDIVTISDANTASKEPFEVKLFDLNNIEIRTMKSQRQSVINLNVRGVKSGQYILVIKKGKEKVSRHIIIL